MADGSHLDEAYLERRAGRLRERTFLGGAALSARAGWLLFFGFAALVGATAVLWRADRLAGDMAEAPVSAARLGAALAHVEAGFAEAGRRREAFRETRDVLILDAHAETMTELSGALDALGGAVSDAAFSPEARRRTAAVRESFDHYKSLFEETVRAATELGLTDDEGLLGRLNAATETLQKALEAAGMKDTTSRAADLGQRIRLSPAPMSERGQGFIELEYEALKNRAAQVLKKAEDRETLQKLIDAHREAAFTYINARAVTAANPERFRRTLESAEPGLKALRFMARSAAQTASADFKARRSALRLETAAAVAGIIAAYIFAAWVLLRSVTGPVARLADTAARLAHGDKGVSVPTQGNNDETGALARALDKWLDDLAGADHLRLELEDAGQKISAAKAAEAEAVRRAERAEAEAEAGAGTGADVQTQQPETPEAETPEAEPPPAPARDTGDSGPIFTVSRELSQFTEYISAAARDVERTEALLRALETAGRLVEELADTVSTFRDRTHALVFAASDPGEGDPAETLAPRFEAVRAAVERAERTVEAVRITVDGVAGVAHGIAETASSQALDATRKLLARSEYLQTMLDDIMTKLNTAGGE